jgi:hypothetical protein
MFSPCSDVAAAQWITARDQHWWDLVTLGPTGFPAYARLRFIPDPAYEGQSGSEGANQTGVRSVGDTLSESEQLRIAVQTLLHQVSSPTEGYLLMWDGYGESMIPELVLGIPHVVITDDEAPPDPSVSPAREYYLVRVSLPDFVSGAVEHSWQAATGLPMQAPAFIWPADQTWCITSDVDPHWAGIGAAQTLIDFLLTDALLDVVRVEKDQKLPFYH